MGRIVVVGGGLSGLATAVLLADGGRPVEGPLPAGDAHEVTVLEAGPLPGGFLQSDREHGRILDHGITGWREGAPELTALLGRAGLQHQVVLARPEAAHGWLYTGGRLHPAPDNPAELLRSTVLPWSARLRLCLEPLIPRGPSATAGGDETVAEFVQRRLGRAAVDVVAVPLAASIYAAEPEDLSLKAAFPRLAELEARQRSVLLGLWREASHARLATLEGGTGTLPLALAHLLGDRVRCGVAVQALERRRDHWNVHADEGTLEADAVVLATPAAVQARLLRGVDLLAAEALDEIPMAPLSIITTAWPREAWDHPPTGAGVWVARGEDVGVLGASFVSNLFPVLGRPDELLLRTLVGGTRDPEGARLDEQTLIDRARAANRRFFGPERADPLLARVVRHAGVPVYSPGHLERVRAVRGARSRHPGLYFAGNHLDGPSLGDCSRAAARLALKIHDWLTAET